MKNVLVGFLGCVVIGMTIMVGPLAFATDITVSGGTLKEFDPGTLVDFGTNAVPVFGPHGFRLMPAATGTNTFHMYLDMGSNRWVSTVTVLNRNGATALQFGSSHIYAAVDETAGGFDPANLASYDLDVHTTVSPTPNVYDASVLRTNTLTRAVYRRYLRYDLLGNFWGAFPQDPGKSLADAGDIDVAGALPQGLAVAAGMLYGLAGNDTVATNATPFIRVAGNSDGDNLIRLLLDLGSRKNVKTILATNRLDGATSLNIKDLDVKAAPNEGMAGFDPHIYTNYSATIGSGTLMPASNAAGVSRVLALTETRCRYLMLEVTANFFGSIGPSGNYYYIHFENLGVEIVPPPKGTVIGFR